MDIILASSSPRRRELLASAQLDFSSLSVDVDETRYDNESPADYIERMVATKAKAAIQQLNDALQIDAGSFTEPLIILTSDTIGVLADGTTVLVKPMTANTLMACGSKCLTLFMRYGQRFKPPKYRYHPNGLIPQTINQRYKWSNNSKSLSAQR